MDICNRSLRSSNKNLRNIDIAKLLIKIAKSKIKIGSKVKIKFIKDRPGHDFRYALNSNKVMKKLKWKPIIKLNIGLKKTFLWYSNNSNYYSTLKRKDFVQRLGIKK